MNKNFIQNCLLGITFIQNKTCFGTAVHQLILVQTNVIPDGHFDGHYTIVLNFNSLTC